MSYKPNLKLISNNLIDIDSGDIDCHACNWFEKKNSTILILNLLFCYHIIYYSGLLYFSVTKLINLMTHVSGHFNTGDT